LVKVCHLVQSCYSSAVDRGTDRGEINQFKQYRCGFVSVERERAMQ